MKMRAFRRTLTVGVAWAAAMGGLLATSPSAAGQEAVSPGVGSAYAQGIKIDPRTGQLSIGLTYGMSMSGHQNTVAIAEARSLDLGIIGTLLGGEACDGGDPTLPPEQQPQPLESRSSDEGAGQERVSEEAGVERRVLASEDPVARSSATVAGLGEPGMLEITGAHSTTESGMVDGARLARAVTEIGELRIADAIVLRGLRWEAVHQTAPEAHASGSFTVEGIELAGQRLPLPAGDLIDAAGQLNALLEPLGFRISPPVVRHEGGIQFVDPLKVSIIPSDARDGLLGPIFGAIQPVREALFDAIIDIDCGNATYITLLDIVLGSISGAGSANIEIGGVSASTDDIELTSFLGGLGAPPSLGPPPGDAGAGADSGASLATGGGAGGATPAASTPGSTVASDDPAPPPDGGTTVPASAEQALGDVVPIAGSRGGALAGVGLGGLLLLAALAGADRAKMRKAQRSVLLEAF